MLLRMAGLISPISSSFSATAAAAVALQPSLGINAEGVDQPSVIRSSGVLFQVPIASAIKAKLPSMV